MSGLVSAFVAVVVSAAGMIGGHHAEGPGRLADGPIAYRNTMPSGDGSDYSVFFRTRSSFARGPSAGSSHAGALSIAGYEYSPDGFGPIVGGKVHCYKWGLNRAPRLTALKIGQRVRIRLSLRHTSTQTRTVRLRYGPRGGTAGLRVALASIGCRGPIAGIDTTPRATHRPRGSRSG